MPVCEAIPAKRAFMFSNLAVIQGIARPVAIVAAADKNDIPPALNHLTVCLLATRGGSERQGGQYHAEQPAGSRVEPFHHFLLGLGN
jgi:hypothetical protein